jgi:hypothetical protein
MIDMDGNWWLGDFGATVKKGTTVMETTTCEYGGCWSMCLRLAFALT